MISDLQLQTAKNYYYQDGTGKNRKMESKCNKCTICFLKAIIMFSDILSILVTPLLTLEVMCKAI